MKTPNYQSAEYRPITIKTTDGSTIHGKVNLAYKQRVSDLFTKDTSPFLIMVLFHDFHFPKHNQQS